MPPFPTDEDLQLLAAGYVLGDLSSEERVQFQQLLVAHPKLAQTVASLQETLAMLPRSLPQQQPNGYVKTALLASAKAQSNSPSAIAPQRHWLRRYPRTQQVAAAALMILGGFNLWLSHRVVSLQAQLTTAEQLVEIAVERDTSPTFPTDPAYPQAQLLGTGPEQLIQDHLGSLARSQGPADIPTTDLAVLLTQLTPLSSLEKIPTLTAPDVQLLGGSRCQFGPTQGLRISYQLSQKQTVSVYKLDFNSYQFPTLTGDYVTVKNSSISLIFWREQDYLYALAAELSPTKLRKLAKTL